MVKKQKIAEMNTYKRKTTIAFSASKFLQNSSITQNNFVILEDFYNLFICRRFRG